MRTNSVQNKKNPQEKYKTGAEQTRTPTNIEVGSGPTVGFMLQKKGYLF